MPRSPFGARGIGLSGRPAVRVRRLLQLDWWLHPARWQRSSAWETRTAGAAPDLCRRARDGPSYPIVYCRNGEGGVSVVPATLVELAPPVADGADERPVASISPAESLPPLASAPAVPAEDPSESESESPLGAAYNGRARPLGDAAPQELE